MQKNCQGHFLRTRFCFEIYVGRAIVYKLHVRFFLKNILLESLNNYLKIILLDFPFRASKRCYGQVNLRILAEKDFLSFKVSREQKPRKNSKNPHSGWEIMF